MKFAARLSGTDGGNALPCLTRLPAPGQPSPSPSASPGPPQQEFPSLLHPLITERDQFMAFMLRKLAARAQTVVAIVGAGHLQGIRCAACGACGGRGATWLWLRVRCTRARVWLLAAAAWLSSHAHRACSGVSPRLPPAPCSDHWEKDIDIAEITAMPAERLPLLRWRRVALLTAGGVLVSTALLRYTGRR